MQAPGIDLAQLLHFDQAGGRIRLQDYRMVLLSACALGALRRELIETLGQDRARGLMKRFGYAAGLADGRALAERFPEATARQHLDLGPALHGLEGVASVERIPERTQIDLDRRRLHIEAYWKGSYEAEQHLELFGPSEDPVCWTLAGYATGHSSAAVGERTVVVETECRAMGHEHCRFVLGYARELEQEAAREAPDYEGLCLPEVLDGLQQEVQSQSRSLQERERRIARLEGELARQRLPADFVGDSPSLREAVNTARTVAPVDATALVLGESGTGKEMLARLIHDHSPRRDRAFVAVNCSALPEALQEAELFGHTRGAFTGAVAASQGLFEAADGGTLFLDEVGDLALSAQTKILRAVQEGEIKRVGETRTRRVDVRVVAATHRDLRRMVELGTFREDLYYRLGVVSITAPPLREREHDVLLLAEHFLKRFAKRFGRPRRSLTRKAQEALLQHPWPGNVRELEHAMERAVILSEGGRIRCADLPETVRAPSGRASSRSAPRSPAVSPEDRRALLAIPDERARIQRALELGRGNRERTAALLDTSRTSLWRRMRKLGLLERAGGSG